MPATKRRPDDIGCMEFMDVGVVWLVKFCRRLLLSPSTYMTGSVLIVAWFSRMNIIERRIRGMREQMDGLASSLDCMMTRKMFVSSKDT